MAPSHDPKKKKRNTASVFAAILFIVLTASTAIGAKIWTGYRDSLIQAQKHHLLLTVQSLGRSMGVFIQEYVADLDGLIPVHAGQGELKKYVDSHSQFVYDVVLADSHGDILESTKGFRIQNIYSASQIDSRTSLLLASLENGEMYLALQMDTPGGGAIFLMIDLERYYETLIQELRVGTNGYMVLKDSKGIILMHPEKAQWGIEIIQGRMGMYPNLDLESLKAMISNQMQGQTGVEEYYSYWWLESGNPRVRKVSAYVPVPIGEDFLILSAVMDYNEIYVPIAEGVFKFILLFLAFSLAIILMAAYIVRMMMQKQKDMEQIAYLTELNRLLEEMHRSEENIAHQQRLQIMGTMTGGIAHEFNNMLTPIMGYADLLMLELPESSELYGHALEICEAAEKAKEMIQQISSLSRKNMETAYKNTDAARALTRALKMVRSICPPNIRLEEQICLEHKHILCNETQIYQSILNICVNAIHAIGQGEGRILVKASVVAREELNRLQPAPAIGRASTARFNLSVVPGSWNHYVCIDIQDNGCGMGQETLNQIFDPFFTTKKGGKGTGLGLALVEQIISSHKGGLYVESEPEKGSTFCVYLPVNEQSPYGADGRTPGTAGLDGQEGRRFKKSAPSRENLWKLLIVDDNPKVLRLLEKDGAKLPIELHCHMDFQEALKALASQEGSRPFDAAISEQEISGHSAIDFYMSIQGQYPDLIKIIMADRVARELVEARQRGIFNAYIDKPVSLSSILEALKPFL